MSTGHPTLDGMPEPPPAWVRPDEAVRMPAQGLDFMLAAALPHCSSDEELPVLNAVHIDVRDGLLEVQATDRYTLLRERRPVNQTCGPFDFLLRSTDAKSLRVLLRGVLRGLEKDEKADEPVDVVVEQTDEGPTLRVLGRDLDVRFTREEGDFPSIDAMVDRLMDELGTHEPRMFPLSLNPTLLARIVPAQSAGRGGRPFRFSCVSAADGRQRPVVVRPVIADDELDDDLVIAVMPFTTAEPTEAPS